MDGVAALGLHWVSIAVFAGTMAFYLTGNLLVQKWWYTRPAAEASQWKSQPERKEWVGAPAARGAWWPWASAEVRPGRHAWHWALATTNTTLAAVMAAVVAETTVRGISNIQLELPAHIAGSGWLAITWFVLSRFLAGTLFESVAEYYWHRIMHTRWFYARFHKLHHYYKSPAPFDDMFIHPLEGLGYYCILFGPAVLIPQHITSFLLYMGLMGITGILDHCGVRLALPYVYDTLDHDVHHAKFSVNYGFPFIALDLLHGTYRGHFMGQYYDGGLGAETEPLKPALTSKAAGTGNVSTADVASPAKRATSRSGSGSKGRGSRGGSRSRSSRRSM